ncbi:MAG: small multi-drug export protein [Planctomycetota bacterium]|nr:small multi-drug export protein [Planctomycetota bacterium]
MALPNDLEHADTSKVHQHVMDSFEEFEASFRRQHPYVWASSILGPILVTLAILAAIAITSGFVMVQKVVSAAFVTFVVFSRFVILGGEEAQGNDAINFLTTEQLFLMLTYMDLIMAVVVTFHIGLMFKLPYLGNKIGELVADGQFVLKCYPSIRRAAFFGLVLFVMIPLAATGCIGGAIFGRLLGMGRALTLAALCLGSLAGNTVMYVGASWINQLISKENPYYWHIKIVGLVVLVAVIMIIERYYRALKKRVMSSNAPENSKS